MNNRHDRAKLPPIDSSKIALLQLAHRISAADLHSKIQLFASKLELKIGFRKRSFLASKIAVPRREFGLPFELDFGARNRGARTAMRAPNLSEGAGLTCTETRA